MEAATSTGPLRCYGLWAMVVERGREGKERVKGGEGSRKVKVIEMMELEMVVWVYGCGCMGVCGSVCEC